MSNRNLTIGLVVAILIAIGGYFYPQVQEVLGRVGTAFPNGLCVGSTCAATQNDLTVGNSGTPLERVNMGQCYFAPSATTITASSTISIDCQATQAPATGGTVTKPMTISALTGVASGDNVIVQLSTTTSLGGLAGTASGQVGLVVVGASASSTDGYITVRLANLHGTTFTWPIGLTASGTASFISSKTD